MARLIIGILIVLASAAFYIFLPNYKRAHADSDITYCHTNLINIGKSLDITGNFP